jgi:hypothetical protein
MSSISLASCFEIADTFRPTAREETGDVQTSLYSGGFLEGIDQFDPLFTSQGIARSERLSNAGNALALPYNTICEVCVNVADRLPAVAVIVAFCGAAERWCSVE